MDEERVGIEMSDIGLSEPPFHSSDPIPKNYQIEEALKILDQSDWLNIEEFLYPWGEQGVTLVHLAAYRGNIEMLKQAVGLDVDLDAADYLGRCALHFAADQGHVDVVKWLLEYSAADGGETSRNGSSAHPQLSLEDSEGMTALNLAIRAGHVDVAQVLVKAHLQESVGIHHQSENMNAKKFLTSWNVQPIHLAAYSGNLEKLKRSADLDATDKFGRRALHYAASQGHIHVIEHLLERPGAVAADVEATDCFGMNAVHYAADQGHMNVIQYLLEFPTVLATGQDEDNIYELLPYQRVQDGPSIEEDEEERHPQSTSSVSLSSSKEREEIDPYQGLIFTTISSLRESRENLYEVLPCHKVQDGSSIEKEEEEEEEEKYHTLNPRDLESRSLSEEEEERKELPREKFPSTVLSRQPSEEKSPRLQFQDNLGRSPLHLAMRENYVDMVRYLVDSGADVNACDTQELPPIFLAHCNVDLSNNKGLAHYENIIDILVSAEASVDGFHPITGWTVLHYAVLLNSEKATLRLSKHDSQLILRGERSTGDTPLHLAAASGSNEVLCILLKMLRSSSIDVSNKKEWSPLHFAAFAGNLQNVRALIDKGGNLAKKNIEGNTTIHFLSRFKDNVDLVAFFMDIFDTNVHLALKNNHDPILKEFGSAKLDFKVLAPEGQDVPQMAVLSALIETLPRKDQIPILQHPLPQAFISKKWSHLRWVFYGLVIVQVLFTVDISFYAIYLRKDSIASIFRRMLFFFAGIPLCCNFFQSLAKPKCYFRQFENWLSLFCLTISISVAAGGEFVPNATTSWILYPVSVVIPLIWIQTMLLIGRFSGWGFYALIFPTVLKNFLKVFLIGFSIIVGFAISFMVLFHSKDTFGDFWQAVLKTVVMMTGEYDYADLFSNDTKSMADNNDANENHGETLHLPIISSIVFLIFVMLAGIVLMNLMIGLAVNDIQGLLQEGQFGRLLKQAEFIANSERMTESWIPLGKNLTHKLKSSIDRTVVFSQTSRPSGYYDHLMEDLYDFSFKKKRFQEAKSVRFGEMGKMTEE